MTSNQIEYLKLVESQRSNRVNEQERFRANTASELLGQRTLAETQRANLAREEHNRNVLQEQKQYHSDSILLGSQQLAETMRSNSAREALTLSQLDETRRANQVREQETIRSNLAQERELNRSNLAREHVMLGQLDELTRSNKAKESLSSSQLAETIRFNDMTQDYRDRSLEEQHRHSVATEIVATAQQVTNAARLAEQVRHDLAWEGETALHNRAMELKDYSTKIDLSPSTSDGDTNIGNQLPPHTPSGSGGSSASSEEGVLWLRGVISQPSGNRRSTKYYKEGVLANGKTVRKEISKAEYEREFRQNSYGSGRSGSFGTGNS